MKNNKLLSAVLIATLVCSIAARKAFGQGAQVAASLGGIVTDTTGAAIPDAHLKLANSQTGFSRELESSAIGQYGFSLLPPGEYTLEVQKAGFGGYRQEHLSLGLGQVATQDVVLKPGAVSEIVTVGATVPLLNAADANVGTDVGKHQFAETPLNLLTPASLVLLNSSVNNNLQSQVLNAGAAAYGNADQDSGFFNFGGTKFGAAAYLLDGHWVGAGDWDGILYAPSIDEVQELKIQTNTFSAQYGWSQGNVLNQITKSGSRDFHGDAFEFYRNSILDANLFFNDLAGIPKPGFTRNQYGVSAGGPLYIPGIYKQRDKTFIFGLYEGRRANIPGALLTTVPTSDFRAANFSALLGAQTGTDALGRPVYSGQVYNPFTTRQVTAGQIDPETGLLANSSGYIRDPFAGNIIPSNLIDPVASNLIQFWPKASNADLTNNFSATAVGKTLSDAYTIRVDHIFSDNIHLFGRWSQKRQTEPAGNAYFGNNDPGGPGNEAPNNRWDTGWNYTQVLRPTLILSLTAGWARWVEGRDNQGYPFKPSSLGLPALLDNPGAFPGITLDGQYGLGSGGPNSFPRETRTLAADTTWTRGRQTLNFGFIWLFMLMRQTGINNANFYFPQSMTNGPNPTQGSATSGAGFASFLLGTGSTGGYTIPAEDGLYKPLYGLYLQDDWKVTRDLTLNLGLRYDIQPSAYEQDNKVPYFNPTATNPLSSAVGFTVPGALQYPTGGDHSLYNPQFSNFAPRLGVAWHPENRFVVRSGFGLYYMQNIEIDVFRGWPTWGYSQNTPWVGTVDNLHPNVLLSNPFPQGLLQPTGNTLGGLTNVGETTDALEHKARPTPYVEQWMLGLQYTFTPHDLLDVTYVGNHGVKQPFGPIELAQLPDKDLALGNALLQQVANPFYGHISTSSCGLNEPTVQQGQLLTPYPQYCGLSGDQHIGAQSWYDALELNYKHQWSNGLEMMASFTASKFLSNTSGNESWAVPGSSNYQDYNNLAAEKSLDGTDVAKSFVLSYVYELPVGRGHRYGSSMSKPVDAVLGGWQIAGVTSSKGGNPLPWSLSTNTTYSFGGGQRPNISGNPLAQHPTINQWLNPAAFSQPATFTFGDAPRFDGHARGPDFNNSDFTISKWFQIKEQIRVQFRGEAFNFFNHPNFYQPNTQFENPAFGTITEAFEPRSIQLAVKGYW